MYACMQYEIMQFTVQFMKDGMVYWEKYLKAHYDGLTVTYI